MAIGVGFFSGVKAAAPDMRITHDRNMDACGLYNLRIVSTYGFNDNDVSAVSEINGAEVFTSYFTDLIVHTEGRPAAAGRLIALTDEVLDGKVNAFTVTEGRLPENERECLVDASMMKGGPKVGSTVTFTDNFGAAPDDKLTVNEYTVVGKVISPMYIDKTSRGSTSVGNGSIEAAYYIPEKNFCFDYFTELYVRLPELDRYICYSDDYRDRAGEFADTAEKTGERRAKERFAEIKDEANDKLADAEKEYSDAKAEYDEKIADAEKKIADGEKEIEDGEKKLADGEAEIADNKQKLADGEAEIAENEQKLIDAEKEIADNEKKLADAGSEIAENERKLADGEKEIADSEKKLRDAKKAYSDGLAKYEDGLSKYNAGLAEYEENRKKLEDGRAELEAGQLRLSEGEAALEAGKKELAAKEAMLTAAKSKAAAALGIPELTVEIMKMYAPVNAEIAALLAAQQQVDAAAYEIEANEKQLAAAKAQLDLAEAEISAGEKQLADGKKQLDDTKKQLDDAKKELDDAEAEIADGGKQLDDARAELEDGRKQLDDAKEKLADGRKQLDDAKAELEDGRKQLDDAKAELEDGRKKLTDGEKELADGRKELEDARVKLADGKKELEDAKAEGEEKLSDARKKLDDAHEKIDDLKEPVWYVFTRDDGPGYTEYGENADRINNIASVFPVFFIIVAMLVCLTTMSRMIEDQRVGIGTLKALGYRNRDIIFKYMFYALSAAFMGCIVGCGVGMKLFPFVIMTAYGMLYDMPAFYLGIDFVTAIAASAVFMAAIALTVWLTARSALGEQAAQLMRPRAPKNGKRIFLERVTPIWKHFNFSGKVTARNLFRYKRKMFMTVIGIAGCTALLLTGLALYDSINDVISKQFYDIQDYQGMLVYDSEEYPDSPAETADIIAKHGGESIQVYLKMTKVYSGGKSVNAYIAVPSDPARFTADFFDLRSRTTGEKFTMSDGDVYLDEKSTLLLGGIGAGREIQIEKSETEKITVTLTAPFENYPNHYMYMTPATYEDLFDEKPAYNTLYFRHDLGEGEAQDKFGEELLTVDGAINVTFNSNTMTTFTTMLESLSLVIMVIIAAAGALAFVVMYNLTNINITERIREIATLKVLGFYDGEVDRYIFRENIILSLIGTGVGLILGIFLARFVITTAEVDLVMFGRNIYPMSFVLAAVVTMVFSLFVTLAMHRRLQRVNMIEALKSVE